MRYEQFRGFKVSWIEESCDDARLDEVAESWLERKGDPAVLMEVYKVRDGYEVRGLFVTVRLTTEKVFLETIGEPTGINIECLNSVVRTSLLAENVKEDKTGRYLCVCRGW